MGFAILEYSVEALLVPGLKVGTGGMVSSRPVLPACVLPRRIQLCMVDSLGYWFKGPDSIVRLPAVAWCPQGYLPWLGVVLIVLGEGIRKVGMVMMMHRVWARANLERPLRQKHAIVSQLIESCFADS